MQCLAQTHTAEVMKSKTLLGSPSNLARGVLAAGRFLPSHCSCHALAAHLHGGGARPQEPGALVQWCDAICDAGRVTVRASEGAVRLNEMTGR